MGKLYWQLKIQLYIDILFMKYANIEYQLVMSNSFYC